MVSGLTLLRADETLIDRAKWSYPAFAEELRRASGNPKEDAAELFRRMVFNALISNTDDHPRNHAVLAKDRTWRLSPAYDLTPTPAAGMERDLAMTVGDFAAIIREMREIVRSQWEIVARAVKVSVKDCTTIRNPLENGGFDFEAAAR